jgi:DUF4097 and DUF4098 domain-containing protein YvlB
MTSELPPQTLTLSNGQGVFIDAESGSVDIANGAHGVVEISGRVPSANTDIVSVTRGQDGIHILAKDKTGFFRQGSSPAMQLNVRVPRGIAVHANTYDASVDLHDFDGQASISSTAGDVEMQNLTGQFNVKANRGNVAVGASSGEIQVVGNYGTLSMQDTSGVLGMSTILGTVRYMGEVGFGDVLNLETDHGPVEVQLAAGSDASVNVTTTSGVVTCLVPGLQPVGPGCAGTLQDGLGQLKIRTVSGSVMLQLLP